MSQPVSLSTYDTSHTPTWCPGCGDFGIWMSIKQALSQMGLGTEDAMIIYGVGCHGNMYNWMKAYGFAGLHGRTLPVAQGIKLTNHTLPVLVVSGDGDGMGEGGNHFIHAAKRNPDITVIIHDNQVYGLTTGQAAPTAKQGLKTKSTPEGVTDEPINPLLMALSSGATFVARGFAGDGVGLAKLIKAAIEHKGFALVDCLQPCVTFNKVHTYAWYRPRVYDLQKDGYTPDNKLKAIEKAMEWGDRIPTGIFYQESRPTNEEREHALLTMPLYKQPLGELDIEAMLGEFS